MVINEKKGESSLGAKGSSLNSILRCYAQWCEFKGTYFFAFFYRRGARKIRSFCLYRVLKLTTGFSYTSLWLVAICKVLKIWPLSSLLIQSCNSDPFSESWVHCLSTCPAHRLKHSSLTGSTVPACNCLYSFLCFLHNSTSCGLQSHR